MFYILFLYTSIYLYLYLYLYLYIYYTIYMVISNKVQEEYESLMISGSYEMHRPESTVQQFKV